MFNIKKKKLLLLITVIDVAVVFIALSFWISLRFLPHENLIGEMRDFYSANAYLSMSILFLAIYLIRVYRPANYYIYSLSALFSICTFIGCCYKYTLSIRAFFSGISNVFLFFAIIAGFFLSISKVVSIFWKWFDQKGDHFTTRKIDHYIFELHPTATTFLIIFICWLPYIVIMYPGGVQWDTFDQINQYYRIYPLTNHHPVFSTWLIGTCIDIGRSIGSDNLGVFLYIIFQALVLTYAFALTFKAMQVFSTPYVIRWGTLGFYAIFTVWPSFAQLLVKDTLYTAIFAIFVYHLILVIFRKKYGRHPSNISYVCLFFSSTLLCLLRNNGFYIVAFVFVFSLLLVKKPRGLALRYLGSALVVYLFIVNIILPAYEIIPGSKREMLSIPFQQTARYVQQYGETCSPEEQNAINQVLDFNKIGEIYNPILSDPVKSTYKEEATNKEFLEYARVWIKLFFRHPFVYFSATLHNTYGYYSLDADIQGKNDPFFIENNPAVNTGFLNIYNSSPYFKKGSDLLIKLRDWQEAIPIINILYDLGFYTWIQMFLLFKLLKKRCSLEITVMIPTLTTILICIASPVNAYLRYMLPVMAVTPLIISFVFKTTSEK